MASASAQTIEIAGRTYAPARKPLSRRLVGWLLRALWGLLRGIGLGSAATLGGAGAVLRMSTTGRHRHHWWPVWFAAAAVIPVPHATLAWLVAAIVFSLRPLWPRRDTLHRPIRWLAPSRQVLSSREMTLLARACAVVAWWQDAHAYLTRGAEAVTLAGIVVGFGAPWWKGRRTRPAEGSRFLARWEDEVAPAIPKLKGAWIEWDDAKGMGVLELEATKASDAARLDENVEWVLGLRRGMVTIANDPQLTVRQVRVVLSESPEGRANRLHMWQGPTLKDGRYHMATTETNQEVWVALRGIRNGRARFFSWDGPTSTGKGGSMRITALECALDPDTLLLIADGKWGAGLPYLRAGAASYAATPEQVNDQCDRVELVLQLRATRYGQEGRDSFVAGPGEPHIVWMLDELPRILERCPRVAGVLNRISAIGGSLGVTFKAAKQRGDASSWGTGTAATTTRTNVMGGGGRWVGPSDDHQGARSNNQASALDASKLPRTGGWCYILDGGDPNPPPCRGLWVPNRRDVAEKGADAPYGTVEDWLERDTVHPELRDAEHVAVLGEPTTDDGSLVTEPAQGEPVVRLDAPKTVETLLALMQANGEDGKTRKEWRISLGEHGVTVTDRRVSQILDDLRTGGRVINDNGTWRAA